MGLPVEVNNLMLGSLGGYTVGRSLRFRSSASAYLSRTPSASNRQTWTWSGWVKRGAIGTAQQLFGAWIGSGTTDTNYFEISYNSDQLQITGYSTVYRKTTQVFRDPSAWYHIIVALDTTQATASNRVKLYINGVQVTAFATSNDPTLNSNLGINGNYPHGISAIPSNAAYFDGYLAEVNFIDGQQLTPSSFGAYDTNGVWQPKKYTGTYGTNGFYLPFSNTTSTTTLVQDSSGNGNNWTPNNISLTAGTTYDSMIDSPTVSASSSNYAVLNPLLPVSVTGYSISDGNLKFTTTNVTSSAPTMNLPQSGKWYWEATLSAGTAANLGVVDNTYQLVAGSNPADQTQYGYSYDNATGKKINNGIYTTYGATYTTNDIIGVAFDSDNGTLAFYKNGTSQGTAFTGLTGKIYYPFFALFQSTWTVNFGQRPFTYTPPSGYKALNTYNLPAPSIANGAQYMAATTYTGNGTAGRVITVPNINEVGFAWVKSRSGIDDHRLANIVTGGNKHLKSNTTDAESTGTNIIQAFSSNTFTVGNDTSVNANGSTYVGWTWAANGTGVTNNSGTITSTVSANTTAGFSVVTYTGTGAVGTIGHGLGVAPSMMIVKRRSTIGNWPVYHISVGNNQGCFLNLTNAVNSQPNFWNSTTPTSSVFTVGTDTETNQVSQTLVAYCFSAVRGYSAMGSWTGNGSSDGPFVFTNFRPRYVMWKRTDVAGDGWWIVDSSRNPYNVATQLLFAQSSTSETAITTPIDFLSNGFKLRNGADGSINGSGGTYIYMAFAENPFSIARAR